MVEAEAGGRDARHDHRRVVLLRTVQQIRVLLVHRDHVELRRRLVEDARPGAAAIGRHVRAAVVRLNRVGGVVGIEPDAVVVAVWCRHGAERRAAVAGALQRQRAHPDVVRVLRIDVDVVEIERPAAQVRGVVHELPGRSRIGRLVESALGARRFDHRVHRRGWLRAMLMSILPIRVEGRPFDSFVQVSPPSVACRCRRRWPVPPLMMSHPLRKPRYIPAYSSLGWTVHRDDASAGLLVDEQGLLPGLAAVGGLEDPALPVRPERRAERRQPHDVGIGRMNDDFANLTGVREPHELPGPARILRAVDAAADDDVAADRGASRCRPIPRRVGFRHFDRANRTGRDLAVADRRPSVPHFSVFQTPPPVGPM